jgi:hypothetical protein
MALSLALAAVEAGAQINFGAATNYLAGTAPAGVALGDFNGDASLDLAVTSDAPDKVRILVNSGDGAFTAPVDVLLSGGSAPEAVVAADVDGDGDLDLVVTRKNVADVQILTNNGGTLVPGATTGVSGLEPRYMAVGDLDGNGLPDVVTSNRDSDDVSVLLNTGGAFAPAVTYVAGARPKGLALADLDGDDLLDIVVASPDTRAVDFLLNLGGGVFGSGSSLSVGPDLRPDSVVAADLDGDGDADIAASTSGNNLNFASVFLNLGSATFAGIANYPTSGINPAGIVAADFDMDGDRDLATSNQDSANVSLLENLGAAVYGAATLSGVGTTPEVLSAGDLDGNGSIDLVSVNRDSNDLSVLLNLSGLFADGFESGDLSRWTQVVP